MIKKDKYQITYNQKNNKADINWSTTTIKNMILYLSIIILKKTKKRNNKEDMDIQRINLKP